MKAQASSYSSLAVRKPGNITGTFSMDVAMRVLNSLHVFISPFQMFLYSGEFKCISPPLAKSPLLREPKRSFSA
jgi:hypothetical protein